MCTQVWARTAADSLSCALQCESGKFAHNSQASVCIPCLGGFVSVNINGFGARDCVACPFGSA